MHRADDAQVIGTLRDMRKEVADVDSALSVTTKPKRRAEHAPRTARRRELRCGDRHADRLAVLAVEARLGIERVHLRGAAVHVEKDDAGRPGRVMTGAGSQRISRIRDGRAVIALGEQRTESDGAESVGGPGEELPPGEGLVEWGGCEHHQTLVGTARHSCRGFLWNIYILASPLFQNIALYTTFFAPWIHGPATLVNLSP
jgi:hypothetical protein